MSNEGIFGQNTIQYTAVGICSYITRTTMHPLILNFTYLNKN